MKIKLILVPYHLGKERIGMGLGPTRYFEADIVNKMINQGYEITSEEIQTTQDFKDELHAISNINTLLKNSVTDARKRGHFPLILGGNCNTALGTLAAFDDTQVGVIWFDAHGDFNTPETTPSGFFDGMPLAIVTGQCYNDFWEKIGKNHPVQESHTLHVGVRDLDLKERESLERTEVSVISANDFKSGELTKVFLPKLNELRSQIQNVYLHIDIDVIDPQEAPGVDYKSPNGLTSTDVAKAILMISKKFRVIAAALTAYNPSHDENNKTLNVGLNLVYKIADIAAKSNI
ncbi:MAG: arginase family protein [Candidatus Hodarchaeales archaeon]|jgi:arginase